MALTDGYGDGVNDVFFPGISAPVFAESAQHIPQHGQPKICGACGNAVNDAQSFCGFCHANLVLVGRKLQA